MRPFRFAVFEKLLEHIETDFTVVQCVAKIAAFVNPSRGNPREWYSGELLDLVVPFARSRVRQDGHVPLSCNLEFLQHRTAVFAIIPNGNEIEFHLWIFFNGLEPAAALQFCLAIETQGRPKMHNAKIG